MKVLLISHNALSTHQSMGKTFLSLFSSFKKEELCQLYVYPTIPDVDACSSYYRITDKDAMKGILRRRGVGGEIPKDKIVTAESVLFENPEDRALYRRKGNHSAFRRLLRDDIWKLSAWYSKDLQRWLERENPTCIFLAPGYAKFIYDVALRIAAQRRIPVVTYICDDYYFVNTPASCIGRRQVRLLRNKTDRIMERTSHLITICEEIRETYSRHFSVPATAIMTGAGDAASRPRAEDRGVQAISFFGNIGCRRDRPLEDIGRALDAINEERGTSYTLKIYTASPAQEVIDRFADIRSIELCGFLTGEKFRETFRAADMLLHVEAFDDEAIDTVKHSVSTKIADSLASGIPLMAYAPAQVASMAHLQRHQCALTATSAQELKAVLERAFDDAEYRASCVKNALEVAKQYHDSAQNSQTLRTILENIGR